MLNGIYLQVTEPFVEEEKLWGQKSTMQCAKNSMVSSIAAGHLVFLNEINLV